MLIIHSICLDFFYKTHYLCECNEMETSLFLQNVLSAESSTLSSAFSEFHLQWQEVTSFPADCQEDGFLSWNAFRRPRKSCGGPLLLPAGISEAETLHAHQRMFLNWGPLTFTFTFLGSLTEPKSGNLCKWDATSLTYFSYCSVTVFLIYCNSITDTMLE